MQEEGIEPDACSHAYVLNGLAKAKQWNRARDFFREMTRQGVALNQFSYNAMVEAAGRGSPSPRQQMVQV